MADMEKKRDAPVLIALGDASVTQWVKSYEAYVKRGGTRRPVGYRVIQLQRHKISPLGVPRLHYT